MGIETLIGGAIAAFVAIFAAFFAGRSKGKSKADTDNRIRQSEIDSERVVRSNQAAANAQVKAATESTKVRNEVTLLNDGDALSQLRNEFARDSDGNKSN